MSKTLMNITQTEMNTASKWITDNIYARSIAPLAFKYNGRGSDKLFPSLKVEIASEKIDEKRIKHVKLMTEMVTNLVIRCEATEYRDFPFVEWTVYLKNEGKTDTPVIMDLLAMDVSFQRPDGCEYILHHQKGSKNDKNDYEPYETRLGCNSRLYFAPIGGRSSNNAFPYYCIQSGNEGVNLAIGWPGQWCAIFERDNDKTLKIKVGQEFTNFKLHPDEEIRTPRIVLQFWRQELPAEANEIRSKNIFRRWIREYNMPRVKGEVPYKNFAACSSHQFAEMINANETNQKEFIDRYAEEKLGLDYWWMDAGWYPCDGNWTKTGTWEPDRDRFQNGLRPITDHGRSKGISTILWFEPERVDEGTEIYNNHPEWLLVAPVNPGGMDYSFKHRLFNFGIPKAREWMAEKINSVIVNEGVDFYRQDFNQDPLLYWRANEASDRQGTTENHYITGFLEYWDELGRRHPDMLIDACASGGRRNDIDILKRAIPLIRSDTLFQPVEQQAHFMGASAWLPFHGTGTIFGKSRLGEKFDCITNIDSLSVYDFRSHMSPNITACWDVRDRSVDYDTLRKLTAQWKSIVHYYAGDFYPLTHYTLDNTGWAAWQYDRPDLNEGVVQVFRRGGSPYISAMFKLFGLVPNMVYSIIDIDTCETITMTGNEMMEKGLAVNLYRPLDTIILVYRKSKDNS